MTKQDAVTNGNQEGSSPADLIDGNARRAVDLHEGDTLDADGLVALVRAAAAPNAS